MFASRMDDLHGYPIMTGAPSLPVRTENAAVVELVQESVTVSV